MPRGGRIRALHIIHARTVPDAALRTLCGASSFPTYTSRLIPLHRAMALRPLRLYIHSRHHNTYRGDNILLSTTCGRFCSKTCFENYPTFPTPTAGHSTKQQLEICSSSSHAAFFEVAILGSIKLPSWRILPHTTTTTYFRVSFV
jgi:hypothetical protein